MIIYQHHHSFLPTHVKFALVIQSISQCTAGQLTRKNIPVNNDREFWQTWCQFKAKREQAPFLTTTQHLMISYDNQGSISNLVMGGRLKWNFLLYIQTHVLSYMSGCINLMLTNQYEVVSLSDIVLYKAKLLPS